jgi:hypothetical protein
MVGRLIKWKAGAILDPCAGEGEALDTLAQTLSVPPELVYGVELERDRRAATAKRMPEAHILEPCSFFDAKITAGSFSVVWCNPPFDHNVKGGRAEVDFLLRVTRLLIPGGILCLVIPEHVAERCYQPIPHHLAIWYEKLAVLTFPEEHRPFREVVIIGIRRRSEVPLDSQMWDRDVMRCPLADCTATWETPERQVAPKSFEKAGMTPEDLWEALSTSPLWKLTTEVPEVAKPRPPLPLSRGHLALLLASGQLDGVVSPPGETPHAVRGTARKVPSTPTVTIEELEGGGERTVTTIQERIELVVRTVTPDGHIRTLA